MAEQNKSGGSSGSRSRSGGSSSSSRGNRSRSASNRSRSRSRGSSNGGSPSQRSASQAQARGPDGSGEPDVLLDVPQLKVDEIGLEVENLHARIALEASLGDLLQLHVGADVVIDKVALEIKGVDAQAQLKARLENVYSILDRTLQTVDENPEILSELAKNSERVQAVLASGESGD
jgi:hypothetical protein